MILRLQDVVKLPLDVQVISCVFWTFAGGSVGADAQGPKPKVQGKKPQGRLFARAFKAVKRVAKKCFQAATQHLSSLI